MFYITYTHISGLLGRMRTGHMVVVTTRALLLNKYFNSQQSLFLCTEIVRVLLYRTFANHHGFQLCRISS